MRKSDFTGTSKVFEFTLSQYLKSKSTIIVMVLTLVFAVGATFFIASALGNGILDTFNADTLIILNGSDYELLPEDIIAYAPEFEQLNIVISADSLESVSSLLDNSPYSAAVNITKNGSGVYSVSTLTGAGSKVTDISSSLLYQAVSGALYTAHIRAIGIADEQLNTALAPFTVNSMTYDEFISVGEEENVGKGEGYFMITYAYSLIVMMLVVFSSAYIVRSIVEEKASKLVELLMVSVKPLALLLGKILATMCFMLLYMLLIILCIATTALITSNVMDISITPEILAGAGIPYSLDGIGFLIIFVVMVSISLGYLTFSLIGGIAGASCSNMEDVGVAVNIVSFISLFGYLAAIVSSIIGNRVLMIICSLFPLISIFTAPANYITGVINIYWLCLSWLLQIALIALLAVFGSRVYGALIIHRGNRVKLGQLFKIAREAKRGA